MTKFNVTFGQAAIVDAPDQDTAVTMAQTALGVGPDAWVTFIQEVDE